MYKTSRIYYNFAFRQLKNGRNDTIEMREAILNMMPNERKRLDINKSTLWHMQKNLREGMRVKIYDKVRCKMAKSE